MTWQAPEPGKAWDDAVVDRAIDVYRQTGGSLAAVKATLDDECHPKGPSKGTIRRWLADVDPDTLPDPADTERTAAATEERRRRTAKARGELAELLVDRLARPAAELLAGRLAEAVEDEELIAAARERYTDALKMERQASADFGPEARKDAAKVTKEARIDLKYAERRRPDVRELVGVLTRAVGDHLDLEGEEVEREQVVGDLVVELVGIPRPDPAATDDDAVQVQPDPEEAIP